ncbi:hypothetical protein BC30090_3271 [Bacillus cereus]|nr:hypothetical protein CON32_04865 [Bacillus cereus]BCD24374.1 hypothetical protein BC30090_3271 [Bacillus cereus]
MLLQENSFNDEGSNKPIFVPRPSFTQQGVYDALYRLCWDENRFIGPGFEIRCGRCSLDIVFYAKNGEKICYEIDCDDYHDKVKDKNRDFYLKKALGWKIYRVDCAWIDALGFDTTADLLHEHLLVLLGIWSGPVTFDITTSFHEEDLH